MTAGRDFRLDAVEETSLMVAFWRACESRRPDALVVDEFAIALADRFLSAEARSRFETGPLVATMIDLLALRTRAIDELIAEWTSSEGLAQVVNLGSGLDSRGHRLALPAGTLLVELDRSAVVACVESLQPADSARCRLVRLVANLDQPESLERAVLSCGLDPRVPVAWVIEGVLEYLDVRRVPQLVRTVTALSAPGSRLVAAVLDPAIVTFARDRGDTRFPWKRLEPVATYARLLGGWDVDDVPSDVLGQKFGRDFPVLFRLLVARRVGAPGQVDAS